MCPSLMGVQGPVGTEAAPFSDGLDSQWDEKHLRAVSVTGAPEGGQMLKPDPPSPATLSCLTQGSYQPCWTPLPMRRAREEGEFSQWPEGAGVELGKAGGDHPQQSPGRTPRTPHRVLGRAGGSIIKRRPLGDPCTYTYQGREVRPLVGEAQFLPGDSKMTE